MPVGHTSCTKPWANSHYNTKLGQSSPNSAIYAPQCLGWLLHSLIFWWWVRFLELHVVLFKIGQLLWGCGPRLQHAPNTHLWLVLSHLWASVPSNFSVSPWYCWWSLWSWPAGLKGSQLLHTSSFSQRFACHLSDKGQSVGWIPSSCCSPQGFDHPPTASSGVLSLSKILALTFPIVSKILTASVSVYLHGLLWIPTTS